MSLQLNAREHRAHAADHDAALYQSRAQWDGVTLTGVTDAAAINQVVTGTAPTTASVTTAAPIAFITYNAPTTSTHRRRTPVLPAAQTAAVPVRSAM